MESHVGFVQSENKNVILPRWEQDAWNEYNGSRKLKVEAILPMSIIEQTNKTACFIPLDSNYDKPKPVRETYKCDECPETMTSKQMLKQHKDGVHNDRKTFRCTISNCSRAFTSANYLKNHIDIEHTDCSEACIPCPKKDCGLFYPNNYRLKRHIRQDHKQEKLYQCQICARRFSSLEVRNNHMNTKHGNTAVRENFSSKVFDNYYRLDQNKESENDTVYAASPISSRFESLQSSIDTTCEAQWLTKTCDSNPPLSKQIDRILCDIFSDKYQDNLHSNLSSSELAIAIVSLEEANDDGKRKQSKVSPHPKSIISGGPSPLKQCAMFPGIDKNLSTANINNRFQYNPHNGTHKTFPTVHTYPQSNTESEGHSTESQRSFLINSSQHEEFSDISMESHIKDVFSSAVDKWNGHDNVDSRTENPIKLFEYTCLDTMFDDFHEIIAADSVPYHPFDDGHGSVVNNSHDSITPNQDNHLLSLNNMHTKFLGGSKFNGIDNQMNQPNPVPSSQIATVPNNYELNRRKMNRCFPNKIPHGPYDMPSHYSTDTSVKDSPFPMELQFRCQLNPALNGPMCPQDGRIRMNYPIGYQYGPNQIIASHPIYYNRDPSAVYIRPPDRSPYQVFVNGHTKPNHMYHTPLDMEYIQDTVSQNNQYPSLFRRRAPPTYQPGFSHQMLPSQHKAVASLSYCGPQLPGNSCFPPPSRSAVYVDRSPPPPQSQHQHRHLLCQQPMGSEPQGQPINTNYAAATATHDNQLSECEDSIVSDEQCSSVISNEQRSQTLTSMSSPNLTGSGSMPNCDMTTDAKISVCM